MIKLNNRLTPDQAAKVSPPWSRHSNVTHVDFSTTKKASADFNERNMGALITFGLPEDKVRLLNTLLSLALYPEQVSQILDDIGDFKTPESKAAYLEAATGTAICSRIGGNTEDDFWALAEALVSGEIQIQNQNLN